MVARTTTRWALLSLVAASLFSAESAARGGEVDASLSTREAFVGAPVMLRLEIANASSHDEPVLPDVEGLDIQSAGNPSRSTQTTIINGRRTDRSSAVYAWRVIPRREGAFVIPGLSIQVDGKTEHTRPLRFVATKSEAGDLLLVEVTGEQEKIYVGEPLKLTLNIWIKPYRDAAHQLTVSEADTWQMLSTATKWGPFAERLTELASQDQRPGGIEVLRSDSQGEEHSYYRYQIDATIYPTRPGRINADDLQIVFDYPTGLVEARDPFRSMFDRDLFGSSPFGNRDSSPFGRKRWTVAGTRPLVAQATVAEIDVLPVPTAGRPADYRGTVGKYRIVTNTLPSSVTAGDPITLHIGITGTGPLELVQAPPLGALPELNADFKVSNEPLAGVVQGDVKLFTTTIRPRRAGITQIPAIPLSFFDPESEEFATVYSDPIAIEVAQADQLALGSIVGEAATPEALSAETNQQTPRLDLSNYLGADVIASDAPLRRWPLASTLLVPPLCFAALWGFRRRDRLADVLRGTARQRRRAAEQAVQTAESPAQVAAAVKGYVATCLGRPSASLTRREINAGFQTRGCPPAAQRLDDLLARCELATYASADYEQLAALKATAMTSLAEIALPGRPEGAPRQTRPWDRHRRIAGWCLISLALALTVSTATVAIKGYAGSTPVASPSGSDQNTTTTKRAETSISLSPTQQATILSEANDACERGRQATSDDAATAKEAFSTAADKYQLLIDSGVRNAELYCNAGNAYLQSGAVGRAIANYERALIRDASNSKARANLDVARRESSSPVSTRTADTIGSGPLHDIRAWVSRVSSPGIRMTLLATLWISIWVSAVGGLYLPRQLWRYALISATCLLLVGTAMMAGISSLASPQGDHGIVAVSSAVLRQGPGGNFPAATDQALPEGQSLAVLRTRDSWLQVRTADGRIGWVAAPELERVL